MPRAGIERGWFRDVLGMMFEYRRVNLLSQTMFACLCTAGLSVAVIFSLALCDVLSYAMLMWLIIFAWLANLAMPWLVTTVMMWSVTPKCRTASAGVFALLHSAAVIALACALV